MKEFRIEPGFQRVCLNSLSDGEILVNSPDDTNLYDLGFRPESFNSSMVANQMTSLEKKMEYFEKWD